MRWPHFGGYEHVAALDARSVQALASFALIVVHFRGVDVAIAEPQSRFNDAGTGAAAQVPGSKPNERDLGVVGGNARDRSDRAHVSHFGACGGLTIRESGRLSLPIS